MSYITKTFCINKDKPKMKCNGKCHLKKQLTNQENKEKSPASPIKTKNEVQFFAHVDVRLKPIIPSDHKKIHSTYLMPKSEKHLLQLIQPPTT